LFEFSPLWEFHVDHFIDAKVRHDNWIAFLGSLLDKKVTIDDVLVYYRQHDTNVVGFAHPVSAVNLKRNLSTILPRVDSRGDEFQNNARDDLQYAAPRDAQRRAKE
jgi:hypothetical protein